MEPGWLASLVPYLDYTTRLAKDKPLFQRLTDWRQFFNILHIFHYLFFPC